MCIRDRYTNIRYPFPFDPPYVPQDIPCGAYVHTFEYSRDAVSYTHLDVYKRQPMSIPVVSIIAVKINMAAMVIMSKTKSI